ncbi:MAG: aldehyde dehydrogenase family protein, partial [Actinomycetota bacterium]|nr:aldehyde dehydrogenase family protein [Actinomycetota bacterium]
MKATVRTLDNFIGGCWVASRGERTISDVNPAQPSDVLASVPLSTAEDADDAIAAAHAAFSDWRATSPVRRGQIVARAARVLEERAEELARLVT